MIKSDVFNIKNYEETKVIELKPKLGRNDLCHCRSGKKYKKCCGAKDAEEDVLI